eukprot:TRINITY_DN6534_c0_g3_i1.p1 TRINITY_DN6534_c0_g3~~TRINITY_DN6534_c0_g3_i1.p1  ORF type:complete len:291 (-),score=116.46 TRINITY_DN6534_c0_g3_i1:1354-2226(-)
MKIENNRMKLQTELLKQQISGLESQKKMLSDSFDVENREHFKRLKLKCEELASRLRDLEEDADFKQLTIAKLKEDLKAKEQNIKDLQNQLLDCRENIRREIFGKEIEESKSDTSIVEEYNVQFTKETIEDHKKVIVSLCEEKGMAEAELSSVKADMNTLMLRQAEDAERKEDEIISLHKALEDSEKTIQELKGKLASAEKELETLKGGNKRLLEEGGTLKGEVRWLKEEIARAETEARMNESEVERLSKEIIHAGEEIERLKGESEEYRLQVNELSQQLELSTAIDATNQ